MGIKKIINKLGHWLPPKRNSARLQGAVFGVAPMMKALFTCQYDLAEVVQLTPKFRIKKIW
jgi:hypothetical protein